MQTKYFTTSLEHILAELERIDLLIQAQIMRCRQRYQVDDNFLRLGIEEQKEDEPLMPSCGISRRSIAPDSLSKIDIRTALDHMAEDIWFHKADSKRRGIRLRLDEIEELFNLNPLERDIFLICLAPEFDLLYERLYAYLQDDVAKNRPSMDLVSNLLGHSLSAKLDTRKYFASEAPLCKYALLHLLDDPSQQQAPLPSRCLKVDERVVNHLLDLDIIDPYLIPHVRRGGNKSGLEDLNIPAKLKHHLALMIRDRKVCRQGPLFYFQGPNGMAKISTAEALCKELGVGLLIVDLERMLGDNRLGFENALRLVWREALLQRAALYWQGFDLLLAKDKCAYFTALLLEIEEQRGLTFLAGEKIWEPVDALHDLSFVRIDFPHPVHAERSLPSINIGKAANAFRFSGGQIRDAAATAGYT